MPPVNFSLCHKQLKHSSAICFASHVCGIALMSRSLLQQQCWQYLPHRGQKSTKEKKCLCFSDNLHNNDGQRHIFSFRKCWDKGRGWCSIGGKSTWDICFNLDYLVLQWWSFMAIGHVYIGLTLMICSRFSNVALVQVGQTPRKHCLSSESSCRGDLQKVNLVFSIHLISLYVSQGSSSLANVTLNAGGRSLR